MNSTATAPTTIDESATVVVRREIRIEAPIDVVWALHTDVIGWPAWQTDVDSVQADGPIIPGATFWSVVGLALRARPGRGGAGAGSGWLADSPC
ncbi:SRPBCC family protein [Oerskovia sp. M15]